MNRSKAPAFHHPSNCVQLFFRSFYIPAFAFLMALFLLQATAVHAQGRIDCASLNSKILHRSVRYCVLLPPSYGSSKTNKYPVLYFLHGLGENEQTLLRSGGWGIIEDLRQQHKIGDFLMVAPEGRGTFFIDAAGPGDRYSEFFLSEFLPFIETHFRIIRDRKHRGVTGLSMGGFGALRMAFAHPELFGSVSAQSPALITETPQQVNADLRDAGPLARVLGNVFGNPIDMPHWNANSPFSLAQRNRIALKNEAIYFNCGEQDEFGFAEGASKLHKQLAAEGIRHESHLYPGGHDAEYFLTHLHETIEFHSNVFGAGK
jgi:S-formylglutathione hydrolase FrmB